MSEKVSEPCKSMTDEERLELAATLDKDLDDFIEGLEKQKYTDGWSEDTWKEEIDKHPFFMKNAPNDGDKLHPLIEGLQNLKYDPNENTAEELANHYKEDGNFYMKHKKYRMSIMSYTEGLNQKSGNNEIDSILYNNRSAAQFLLKNYRSSLDDAQKCLALKPDYLKSKLRTAQCLNCLNKFDECIKMCDEILSDQSENLVIIELRKSCVATKTAHERNARKQAMEDRKKKEKIQMVVDELKRRKIKFEDNKEPDENLIQPQVAPLAEFPVSLDAKRLLSWPIIFCYPEFLTSDFHQQIHESTIFNDILHETFNDRPDFDKENKYQSNMVNAYFENHTKATVHKIDASKSISEIVQEKWFFVSDGALIFYIVPNSSIIEKNYIQQERKMKT